MADRIGVMSRGRLVAEGTLEDLRRQAGAAGATLEDTFLALVETDAEEGAIAA
jgi:ABC-2 type transport system ATP-binding protein